MSSDNNHTGNKHFDIDKRSFLRKSFTATAGIAAASVVGTGHAATDRALQIEPNYEYGDKRNLKHVIILMQENRSFDSYFGTMPGARGFTDRYPVKQQRL